MRKPYWLSIALVILLTFFFSRWAFLDPYEPTYLKDYFDHSQWRISQSDRIISDNELYQVSGRELVEKNSFFDINPEVPPVGKYIYGLSAVYLNQPYYSSLLLYFVGIGVFLVLARQLLKTPEQVFFATLLLVLTPLFATQLAQTMLDLPQMVFLMLHSLCVLQLLKHKKLTSKLAAIWIVSSGICLGLFAATKIPFFAPFIVLADLWVLWKKKLLPWIAVMGLTTGLTYLLTFTGYFFDHSLGEWVTAEKWVVAFYLGGGVQNVPLMALITTLTGWYKGWWDTQGWQRIGNWSISWPLSILAALVGLWPNLKAKDNLSEMRIYVRLLVLALFVGTLVIPFWPRYFLLIIPFGLILLAEHLLKLSKLAPIIVIVAVVQFVLFFRPTPNEMLYFLTQDWQKENYEEAYNHLSTDNKMMISRNEYAKQNNTNEYSSVTFEPVKALPWQNKAQVRVTFVNANDQSVTQTVSLVREKNQWKVGSEWKDILPGAQ